MKDERLTTCILDGCDGAVKRKLGTGAGIIFKGSGFYETDYRSESYKSGQKNDSQDKGGSGSTSEKSTGSEKSSPSKGDGGSSGGAGSAAKPAKKDASKKSD